MTEDRSPDCWVDYEIWPGPPDGADPLADIKEMLLVLSRSYGKSMSVFHGSLEPVMKAFGVTSAKAAPAMSFPSVPPPKNHGPRPQRTFDGRGKRRY